MWDVFGQVGLDNFEFGGIEALGEPRPSEGIRADLSKAGDVADAWQFDILDPPRTRSHESAVHGVGGEASLHVAQAGGY